MWGSRHEYHILSYAALGVLFLAASRIYGLTHDDVEKHDALTARQNSGVGSAAAQSGNAILTITLLAAIMQGWMRLPEMHRGYAEWLHVWSLLLTAAAGALGFVLSARDGWRRAYAALTIAVATVALVTINMLSVLTPWQKLEIFATGVGVLMIVLGYIGRFRELEDRHDELTTFGLWLGSLLATAPLVVAVVYHRTVGNGISLVDELALLTIATLMVLTGFIWQVKSTTLHGGTSLAAYLLLVIVSLGWSQQWAVGVYLAIGGGLVFASGLGLSVYRERLLELPDRLARREGVFRIFNWR